MQKKVILNLTINQAAWVSNAISHMINQPEGRDQIAETCTYAYDDLTVSEAISILKSVSDLIRPHLEI